MLHHILSLLMKRDNELGTNQSILLKAYQIILHTKKGNFYTGYVVNIIR